jgi:hypothetical protein
MPIAALLVAASVHAFVWYWYLPAFNTTHTAVEGVERPETAPAANPGLTRRLVFVVVDGLSWDEARALPALAELRQAGVSRMLQVEFPSYTYPAITSLVTGAEPRDSGVRLNGDWEGATGLESFPALAARAGATVSVRTRGWKPFEELMRPAPGAEVLAGKVERAGALARERVLDEVASTPAWSRQTARPLQALTLEYFEEIDAAGHEVGMEAPSYRGAVEHVTAAVARRLAQLDLAQDTMMVVSDHGHRRAGGHGGVEGEVLRAWFFAAGPQVRRGVELPPRPMRDVAATVAVIAGIAAPASNTGRPMLDALTLREDERAAALLGPFAQQAQWLCRLHPSARCDEVPAALAALHASEVGSVARAEQLADALFAARASALGAAADARRPLRTAAAAALAIAGAAIALWFARRRPGWLGFRPAAIWCVAAPTLLVALYVTLLLLRGHRPTFSALPPMGTFVQDTFVSGMVAALITALAAARRGGHAAGWGLLLAVGVPFACLAAWVGCDPRVVVPPLGGVLIFYLAPAVLFAAIAALLIALLCWRFRAVSAQRPSPR